MSGEIGGVILGGSVLLGAMPILMTGVLVAGAVMGTAAIGRTVAENARELEERKRREQAVLNQCSQEMSQAYAQFHSLMSQEASRSREYFEKMGQDMNLLSADLKAEEERGKNSEHMADVLRDANRKATEMFRAARTEEITRIQKETERESARILSSLEAAQQSKMDAVSWSGKTAAEQAGQKAMSQNMMRDADASIKLLQTLAASSEDADFRARAEALFQSYQRASRFQEQGIFQASCAEARKIITTSASLSMEYERREMEKNQIRSILEARLEGLAAEMREISTFCFTDELYGPVEEFMDDFTQDEFSRVQEETSRLLAELRGDGGRQYSAFRLSQMVDDVEERLIPHAQEVIKVGRQKLLSYYERLHALQITGNYMKEQGYVMEWAQPVGDDVTQKLVVHFREPGSGNTIAISLDEGADAEDLGKMAMEVMLYYANGRPVTEAEKKALREGVVSALRKEGLSGNLECTGRVNQEAGDKTMDSEEALRRLSPERIF